MTTHKSHIQAQRRQPRKNKKRIVVLALLVATLVLITVSLGTYYWRTVSQTLFKQTVLTDLSQAQLKLLNENDYLAAYQMTSTVFQQGVSLKRFQDFLAPITHADHLNFTAQHIEGNFGYVSASLQTQKNELLQIEWQFMQEGNKWKIQAIRFSPLQADEKSMNSNSTATRLLTP